MTDHEQVADVLDGAADVIERDGWHQGNYGKDGESVCSIGALRRAAGRPLAHVERSDYPPLVALCERLGFDEHWAMRVIQWNDAPERTKQEVLDALRLAAKDQRRLDDAASP